MIHVPRAQAFADTKRRQQLSFALTAHLRKESCLVSFLRIARCMLSYSCSLSVGHVFVHSKSRQKGETAIAHISLLSTQDVTRSWAVRLTGWFVTDLPLEYIKADLDQSGPSGTLKPLLSAQLPRRHHLPQVIAVGCCICVVRSEMSADHVLGCLLPLQLSHLLALEYVLVAIMAFVHSGGGGIQP